MIPFAEATRSKNCPPYHPMQQNPRSPIGPIRLVCAVVSLCLRKASEMLSQ